MSRAIRLAAGWVVALATTLLLSFVLAAPTTAPEAVVAGRTAPPTQAPTSVVPYSDDEIPRVPHRPPQGWGAGSADAARRQPLPADQAGGLAAALDRARSAFGLNTLALGVRVDGGSWTGASGLARDGVTPLSGESPFGIASITKTFTASLVLQLVEEGRLRLDDEVATLLPDAGIPAGVTVEQLLSHTSGIADLLNPMRSLMKDDPGRTWTGPEVLAQLGAPRFAPGADYAYSNSNFVILGMLVEELTGHPFPDELANRLLVPLGLDDTGVLISPGAPPLMTRSWASAFGPSGYMYSSVANLLDWSDALYGGHVLRSGSLARMLAFNTDGYGLGAQRIELGGWTGYGHSGLLQSFTSLLVHLPDQNVTIAVVGTWQGFEPAALLTRQVNGQPAILDLALAAAGVPLPTASPSATPAI